MSNTKNYTVTATEQRRELGAGGQEKEVYLVYIVTDEDVTGDIKVAKKDWTKPKLHEILTEFADSLNLAFTLNE